MPNWLLIILLLFLFVKGTMRQPNSKLKTFHVLAARTSVVTPCKAFASTTSPCWKTMESSGSRHIYWNHFQATFSQSDDIHRPQEPRHLNLPVQVGWIHSQIGRLALKQKTTPVLSSFTHPAISWVTSFVTNQFYYKTISE